MILVPVGRPNRAESERRLRVAQSRASGNVARSRKLPEYLDQPEVEALIEAAPHPDCQLLMLIQWRGGLRVSEALAVEVGDVYLDQESPVLKVTSRQWWERIVWFRFTQSYWPHSTTT